MESPAVAHPDGHQYGGRETTETSVTKFCYKKKREFISPGNQKRYNHFFFLLQELFTQPKSPK